MRNASESPVQRRSFLARLGAAAAAFGGAFAATSLPATAAAAGAPEDEWKPTRHPQDDWLDQIPGQHRFFFDATSPNGAGEAITFAYNFYVASKGGYGLGDADNAVVICLRHWATPFAFNDAMWAKYGKPMAERIKFIDPKSQQVPDVNVYQSGDYGMLLTNRGTTFDALLRKGTHFAICDTASHAFAGIIANKLGLKADDVYQELRANAVGNAHFVPAGIVAVNRAQERGYAIQYIG